MVMIVRIVIDMAKPTQQLQVEDNTFIRLIRRCMWDRGWWRGYMREKCFKELTLLLRGTFMLRRGRRLFSCLQTLV